MRWIPDSIGWLATAVFAISYFWRDAVKIRKVQAAAASLGLATACLSIHSL